jgi:hypothetical protein
LIPSPGSQRESVHIPLLQRHKGTTYEGKDWCVVTFQASTCTLRRKCCQETQNQRGRFGLLRSNVETRR